VKAIFSELFDSVEAFYIKDMLIFVQGILNADDSSLNRISLKTRQTGYRKRRWQDFFQAIENKAISKIRVGVEHAIGVAKVFHIVRNIFRNHKEGFSDSEMEIACGLHNLRPDRSFS